MGLEIVVKSQRRALWPQRSFSFSNGGRPEEEGKCLEVLITLCHES